MLLLMGLLWWKHSWRVSRVVDDEDLVIRWRCYHGVGSSFPLVIRSECNMNDLLLMLTSFVKHIR